MRWCSFTTPGTAVRLGAQPDGVSGERVLDVGAWARSRGGETPPDLVDLVEASPSTRERVTDLVRSVGEDGPGWVRLEEVRFLAPVRTPNALRDFLAFRDHVERGAARRGTPVPEAWDRLPVFYKGNRRSIIGPDDEVPWPSYTAKLDFECEVAAVVGRGGRDLPVEEAEQAVFGWTVMDDWSARDVQRDETACWLGPAKAKDFATSLGPWVVTPDAWSPDDDHVMVVRVDGEEWARGTTAGRRWRFAELLSWASRDEDLHPTDVLGSGTFGGGCGLDLDRWIAPGQVVELDVEGLGVLRNRIGSPAPVPPGVFVPRSA